MLKLYEVQESNEETIDNFSRVMVLVSEYLQIEQTIEQREEDEKKLMIKARIEEDKRKGMKKGPQQASSQRMDISRNPSQADELKEGSIKSDGQPSSLLE